MIPYCVVCRFVIADDVDANRIDIRVQQSYASSFFTLYIFILNAFTVALRWIKKKSPKIDLLKIWSGLRLYIGI